MRKHLISGDGNFYKANLHSHSTVSDGELTPQQMKELYMQNGYSIIAFTDHSHFVTHNELSDENFLALNGVENAADESGKSWMHNRCCDICFIAGSKDITTHPLQDPKNIKDNGEYTAFTPEYTTFDINKMIATGVKNGFFATYNHPTWSLENFGRYMSYNGMNAMEIFNYGSAVDGYNEYNPDIYDDMLRSGKRIFCIATDDNHNRAPGTRHWDSFGGWTMIKSKSLEYADVASALFNGDFYASRGPVINALWIDTDDWSIHLECEKAVRIVCTRGGRRLKQIFAEEQGVKYLNGAVFSINKDDIYFRITVFDENGMPADTNAYFIDTLGVEFDKDIYKE